MVRLDSRDFAVRVIGWDRLLEKVEEKAHELLAEEALLAPEKRGSGRTSEQMLAAARGSLYIWCNGHLEYPKALARYLGRDDLKIVAPGQLDVQFGRGRVFAGVVVDHAASLTERQWDVLSHVRVRIESEVEDGTGE